MNSKMITVLSRGFILLSAFSLISVSLLAFSDPQQVMKLVNVELNNNDAFSSVRGVYGGVGAALFILLINCVRKDILNGLAFLSLFWGLYAFSRVLTIFTEGVLGEFGNQWLFIETSFCMLSLLLMFFYKRSGPGPNAR